MSLSKISYQLYDVIIQQRVCDGYINATQLCKAHKEVTGEEKYPKYWLVLESTNATLAKLSEVTNISIENLTDVTPGRNGGTWLHPRLAVRFTMWLNDDFSLQVEDWVQKWFAAEQKPVQISFSELNNLIGLLDTAIQATEMTHTILHGLTYFLNRARENLEIIRNIQNTEYVVNEAIYQQQIEKAEHRINNLADRVSKLRLMNPSEFHPVINTIDLDIKDYQKSKEAVLRVCKTSYNSALINFLSVQPDEEMDGSAPILLECNEGEIAITYRKSNIQVKSIYTITRDGCWMILLDYNHLKNHLLKLNNEDITFYAEQEKFYLTINYETYTEIITIFSFREISESDILNVSDFITDNGTLEFNKEVLKQLNLAKNLPEPHIDKENLYWIVFAQKDYINFRNYNYSLWSHTVITCGCHTKLKHKLASEDFLNFKIHENSIRTIMSFNFSKIEVMLEWKGQRILVCLDNKKYLLIDIIKINEYTYYNYAWNAWEHYYLKHYPLINRKILQAHIENFALNGAKYIALKFEENELKIECIDETNTDFTSIKCKNIDTGYCKFIISSLLEILKNIRPENIFIYINKDLFGVDNSCGIWYYNELDSYNRLFVWYNFFGVIELSDDIHNNIETPKEYKNPTKTEPVYWEIAQEYSFCGSPFVLEAVQESQDQRLCQLRFREIVT